MHRGDFVTNYYRPPVKAKGFDTFGPMGPVLVTADEIDPTNSNIRTYVNGEIKQDDNTPSAPQRGRTDRLYSEFKRWSRATQFGPAPPRAFRTFTLAM
ncbi:MAG: fumarylacetoacetate hydrolase family protein [Caldilineaceae bacterium]